MGSTELPSFTETRRLTVRCGTRCRDIYAALAEVPNGAKLINVEKDAMRVQFIFDTGSSE